MFPLSGASAFGKATKHELPFGGRFGRKACGSLRRVLMTAVEKG